MHGLLLSILIVAFPLRLFADSLSMTTWYPAPYGVYSQLRATGNSYFAYNGGNVGIGTANPGTSSKLFVVGNTTSGGPLPGTDGNLEYAASFVGQTQFNGLILGGTSATGHGVIAASGNSRGILFDIWNGTWREAMRITPSGNIGIGTMSPGASLEIDSTGSNGTTMTKIVGYGGNMGTNNVALNVGANVASTGNDTVLMLQHTNIAAQGGYGYLLYGVAGIGSVHRDAIIDLHGNMGLGSNGNVGLGNGLTYRLQLFNCPSWEAGSGCAAKSDGTTWINTSDARLKDVDGKYGRGLTEVSRLQPIRFHYKKDNALGLPSEKEMIGFTAQEVQKNIPEAVFAGQDGYLRFNADPVFWAMLNAIRELKAKNENLEERLQVLESQLEMQAKKGSVKSEGEGTLQ